MMGIILLVLGLFMALFGYKIYRVLLFIFGLLSGILMGIILAESMDSGIMIAGGFVLGILLGVINVLLMRLGVFLKWFVLGFFMVVAPMLNFNSFLRMGINYLFTGNMDIYNERVTMGLVVGLILGIIGAIFCRAFIILGTSLDGGLTGAVGIGILSHSLGASVIAGMIVAALGIVVQTLITRKKQGAAVSPPALAENSVQTETPEQTENLVQTENSVQTENLVQTDYAEDAGLKVSELTETVKQTGGQAAGTVLENSRKAAAFVRQVSENSIAAMKEKRRVSVEKVLANDRDFSGAELLEKAERIFYDSAVLSWVMPFLEAITIVWVILSALIGILYYGRAEAQYFQLQRSTFGWVVYGVFAGIHTGMPVQLISCLLGTVKRNHRLVLGILCGGAIATLVAFFMGNGSIDISATAWYCFPEFILYIVLGVFYYIKVMKSRTHS